MITELGHFALILALGVAIVQMVLPAWGAHVREPRLMAVGEPAALAQLTLITIAFLSLTHAYVTSDFSVESVWSNSHSMKPLLYKVSGVWGNHEGSMLLWVLILAMLRRRRRAVRRQPAGDAARQRARRAVGRSPSPSSPSSCSRPTRSCASTAAARGPRPQSDPAGPRRSPSIRRSSTSATSASRSPSRSPSPR